MAEIILEEVDLSFSGVPGEAEFKKEIPPKEEREINFGMVQNSKLRRKKRSLYVFDQAYLGFRENKAPEKILELGFLISAPRTTRKVAWLSVLLMIACISFAGWSIDQSLLPLEYNLCLIAVAVGCLLFSVFRSSHRAVFYTEKGKIPMFELYVNLPDKKRYQNLLKKLQSSIERAKKLLPADKNRLAMEIAEHRRLFNEGVISEQQYEKAKGNIFKYFSH